MLLILRDNDVEKYSIPGADIWRKRGGESGWQISKKKEGQVPDA